MSKRSRVIGISTTACAIALLLLLFFSESEEASHNVEVTKPSDERNHTLISSSSIALTKNSTQAQDQIENEFITENLAQQIEGVVDLYEQNSRYPVFSIPVTDPDAVEIYEPYEQTSVDTPIFDENGKVLPIKLAAAVDKYQYFVGEQITVRLEISGLPTNSIVSASATIKKLGAYDVVESPLELMPTRSDFSQMSVTFDSNSFKAGQAYGDLVAAITVNINELNHFTTVPLVVNRTHAARLENLGATYIDGAFLTIPLQFSVFEEGYYFVQGYLFEQESDRPLLSIQTEGEMQQGNATLNLLAHQHALKDAGSTGPYTLKIHRSFRAAKSELNEMSDALVALSSTGYPVPGFQFDQYLDEPYIDDETQRRIAALRELTSPKQ